MTYNLTIGWLYPELMSTYGDRGNIITIQKRCQWRGIEVEVKKLDLGFRIEDLRNSDLLFMGGAQDRQQKIVSEDLGEKKKVLSEMIEKGVPGLYICGAYQFLGTYYKEADGTVIEGLGIFDLYTESPGEKAPRLIGNVVVIPSHVILNEMKNLIQNFNKNRSFDFAGDDKTFSLVGFENHGGRTYLGKKIEPFGKVLVGFGNNGQDKTEGALYKNSFGTYLHGPILPKNPHFADYLIKLALENKYRQKVELKELDDSLEWQAHEAIVKRLEVRI